LLIVCAEQPESDIGKAGIATRKYFQSRVGRLLPYIDLQSAAVATTVLQSSRPAKRRKPNAKSNSDEQSAAVIDDGGNNTSAGDSN